MFLTMKDIPTDFEDILDSGEHCCGTYSDKFREAMIFHGLMYSGGTRRSHMIISKKAEELGVDGCLKLLLYNQSKKQFSEQELPFNNCYIDVRGNEYIRINGTFGEKTHLVEEKLLELGYKIAYNDNPTNRNNRFLPFIWIKDGKFHSTAVTENWGKEIHYLNILNYRKENKMNILSKATEKFKPQDSSNMDYYEVKTIGDFKYPKFEKTPYDITLTAMVDETIIGFIRLNGDISALSWNKKGEVAFLYDTRYNLKLKEQEQYLMVKNIFKFMTPTLKYKVAWTEEMKQHLLDSGWRLASKKELDRLVVEK